jgi:hypothetical protein
MFGLGGARGGPSFLTGPVRRTFYAVIRCLEIIFEASRRLDEALRARHPELPCRAIMAAAKSTGVNLTPWLGCLPLSGWNLTSIPTGMGQFSATAIVNDPVLSAVGGAPDGSAPKAGLRRLNDEQLGLRRRSIGSRVNSGLE